MSRRSSSKYHYSDHSGHSIDGRLSRAAAGAASHRGSAGRWAAGYTLAHAGRQLRLGPIAFWVVVGTLVIMAAWTVTTATYFAFREDVLTRLIARQADMQFGYEDRIAELRAQVDRISSRQLLDQEQYEQKLDQILRRQSALESRASALNTLGGDVTGSIKLPARSGEPRVTPLKPSPISDKGAFVLPVERDAPIDPRTSLAIKNAGGVGGAIARLQASLDRVEQRQAAALSSLEDSYDFKARRIRGVLAELGVDVGKVASGDSTGAMGGPFVPARLPKEAIGFERQMHRISIARAQIHRLTRALVTIPVRRPVDGDIEASSGFGVRNDPFTNSPAMHTGIDLGGELPALVRRAGLDQDRLTLRRARHVQGAAHIEVLAVMIEHVHLVAMKEQAGLLVAYECVVVPAVPQRANDLDELLTALVAHVLGRMRLVAEIQRLGRIA
jgi:murein DD-endopeptidase MepM/ murein hydrolase activator NlpD